MATETNTTGSADIIMLDDAWKIMQAVDQYGMPVPFEIEVITLDLNRNTGGQRLHYRQAVLCKVGATGRKNYNYRHNTINIKGKGNDQVRSIHPILIIRLNGKEVAN